MDSKKYPVGLLFLYFLLALLLFGSIYFLNLSSTKRNLDVINGSGIYANIRPLSIQRFIIPKNNEIECLFEVYFGYGSEDFGEGKGEFLSNILIYFYDISRKKVGEYYFKGVILKANTKLSGILWIEKEKYKRISYIRCEIIESKHYKKFNDIYYKNITKIRLEENKLQKEERLWRKREKQGEQEFSRILRNSKAIIQSNQKVEGNKGYLFSK